ncbi:MAG TPA: hypothetical protein VLB32_04625 [Candidatus Acidoferrales bacterium]|nr:hypothetical protein [Candidatus Acidoferrales bacterium]
MQTEAVAKAAYWGGWASAVVAVAYKFLISFGICTPVLQILPRNLWQAAFLLFIASIASEGLARAKA